MRLVVVVASREALLFFFLTSGGPGLDVESYWNDFEYKKFNTHTFYVATYGEEIQKVRQSTGSFSR